ncbi:MAG: DUF1844 domain-containing protein [Candidatus Omnitrophica bacterium]|nr:DUF1844 domain-containing protein [Candidatus Omnitrophota bacterium]
MAEEVQKISKEEFSEFMFIQYISALVSSGMQHLGKTMNQLTGKIEKNLEAAQGIIELLSMLKEKTKGNLSDIEERIISDGMANLQLNYADEVNRSEKEDKSQKKENDL